MVTKLFILLVVVLGVIALAQLMRVYELSSKLTNKKEEEISEGDNRLNAKLMIAFMVVLFGGFIWLMLKYGWTGRGVAASVHGHDLDWLFNLNLIIVILVFFLTNALLFVFAYKYVKKPGVSAFYFPHNNKLELIWTVVPAVVLAVIIILGLQSWNEVMDESKPDAVRIELFSKQFDWTARYAGPDNTLGKYDYKLTDDTRNPLALMTKESIDTAIILMEDGDLGINTLEMKLNDPKMVMSAEARELMEEDLSRKERLIRLLYQMKHRYDGKDDVAAMDDFLEDTLFLCKNQPYEFTFRSKDVIHSAYFPNFRTQMNTVPGAITRFKMTPDKTTAEMRKLKGDENFNYALMCNKICGGSHYKMKMIVVVLEKDTYNKWMDVKVNGVKDKDDEELYKTFPATFGESYYKTLQKKQAEILKKREEMKEAEGEASEEGQDEEPEAGEPVA